MPKNYVKNMAKIEKKIEKQNKNEDEEMKNIYDFPQNQITGFQLGKSILNFNNSKKDEKFKTEGDGFKPFRGLSRVEGNNIF